MEFQISCESLSKGLHRAQGIVEKRAAMPILSNVLIEALSDGVVKLSATDLEVSMSCQQQAEVKQAGSVAVGAKVLYEIVRNLKKQKVIIKKLENNWAEVKSGSSEYRLLGMPVDEFQKIPENKDVPMIDVETEVFHEMIEKTLYSASTDDSRYSLNGCYLEKTSDDFVRMVATDGHRLCLIDRKISKKKLGFEISEGIILPRKGLLEAKKMFESGEGNCKIGRLGNNFFIQTGEVLLVMRLIDGNFPDYKQVLPKEQKIKVEVDRKAFLESLRRVSIFTVENTLGIRLQIAKGIIRLMTSNPDIGEAKEEIPVDYKGQSLLIGFNARYLEEALSVLGEDKVIFSMEDELSPCIIKSLEDNSYLCVIMPMRI